MRVCTRTVRMMMVVVMPVIVAMSCITSMIVVSVRGTLLSVGHAVSLKAVMRRGK